MASKFELETKHSAASLKSGQIDAIGSSHIHAIRAILFRKRAPVDPKHSCSSVKSD